MPCCDSVEMVPSWPACGSIPLGSESGSWMLAGTSNGVVGTTGMSGLMVWAGSGEESSDALPTAEVREPVNRANGTMAAAFCHVGSFDLPLLPLPASNIEPPAPARRERLVHLRRMRREVGLVRSHPTHLLHAVGDGAQWPGVCTR